jgi:D-inositol-3-phosphate glycosyltransferase
MYHTLGEMKNRVARNLEEVEGNYRIKGERQVLRERRPDYRCNTCRTIPAPVSLWANERKLVVIPPGVDTSRFYPIPPDEAKEVIGLQPIRSPAAIRGRIEPLKGVETLSGQSAKIKEQGVDECCPYCLAVIGGDPEADPETSQYRDVPFATVKSVSWGSVMW